MVKQPKTEFQVLTHSDQIKRISNEWDSLADRLKSPLFASDWFYSCAKAFCHDKNLYITIMRQDNKLRAIAPMKIVQKAGVAFLELLGVSDLYEPSGFLYDNPESFGLLLKRLLKNKKPMVLKRVETNSTIFDIIHRICRHRAIVIFRQSPNTLIYQRSAKHQTLEEALTRKANRKIRRKTNQANRVGKASFNVISPTRENLDQWLETLYRVEHAGWKAATNTSILSQPKMKTFVETYARLSQTNGSLRMSVMHVDDNAAAIKMMVAHSNRLWEVKIGYDEAFARCSPGILLTHATLTHVVENQYDGYEFLGEEEAWAHTWTTERKSYASIHIYPFALKSMLVLMYDALSLGSKKLKKVVASMKTKIWSGVN